MKTMNNPKENIEKNQLTHVCQATNELVLYKKIALQMK
jgi:hypothetical protein